MKKSILALAAGLLLAGAVPVQAQDAVEGKKIFDANCAVCHSMDADVVGPALKDVHKRRGDEWLVRFIKNSQELVKSGDKDAVAVFEKFNKMPMPSFGGMLSDEEIAHVIAYIKAESEQPAEAPAAAPAEGGQDDADATVAATDVGFRDLPPAVLLLLGLFALVFILIVATLVLVFRLFVPMLGDAIYEEDFRRSFTGRMLFLMRGDASVVTGEAKNQIHSHHDFDGIQEYDNDLPPWWKAMFYASIVFSIGYMLHYHVFRSGALQLEEYEAEMQQAALFSANADNDPNAVTDFEVLTDAAALEAGKELYTTNCAACHGTEGQGTVGPNLTDEFWLHGGSVNDIFRTVKFGVPAKGMVPWQGKLSEQQMLEISSYILSLQGSNPPNAKEPQGEKY